MRNGWQCPRESVASWFAYKRRAALRAFPAITALLALLGAGCSESPTPPDDAGASNDVRSTSDAPPRSDAPPGSDGGEMDTGPADGSPMVDHSIDALAPDGDAGCECTISDGGFRPIGILSMPCYCAKQDWHDGFGQRPNCPTYGEATTCPDAARSFYIPTYKNCNFVTVNYDAPSGVDMRVYDATTHELVGALRGTDFVVSSCGSSPVGVIQSGVIPGPECEIDQWTRPCDERDAGDAERDAGNGATDGAITDGATIDAGICECELSDAETPVGRVSLGCYCNGVGRCPDYDDLLASCPNGPRVLLEEYAGCNISVIRVNWPSVFETYFYDFTTHELVGVRYSIRELITCGDGGTGALFAGKTTIDASCQMTRNETRCPPDGGWAMSYD